MIRDHVNPDRLRLRGAEATRGRAAADVAIIPAGRRRRVSAAAAVLTILAATWTAGMAGQVPSVPASEAEWLELSARLERNPFYLAQMDRERAVAIVVAALRTRSDGLRWGAYGPGLCLVPGPDRKPPGGEEGRAQLEGSRECFEAILGELESRAPEAGQHIVRSMLVQHLTEVLVDLGDLDRADALAAEELRDAESMTSFMRGNVHYYMNQIRGRVALRRGDRAAAIEYLRLAAETEGSPQLATYGPRLTLARELLEVGERGSVRDFLEDVRRFWTAPRAEEELDSALRSIDAGAIPTGVNWR